jgi:hypothetical protein
MRDDLLDAQAAIDWGKSQLPILEKRFVAWHERGVEVVAVDINPQTGKKAMVAREKEPIPLIVNAEVGAIVNSLRSALDLLAAALAARNGVTPSDKTHFPIYRSLQDSIDPKRGLESKKWLSKAEIGIIKGIKPYEGGDRFLWSLHKLDILRKHERLIMSEVRPAIVVRNWAVPQKDETSFSGIRRAKNETVLFEFPADAPEPKVSTTLTILFGEMSLPVYGHEVVATLRQFAIRVQDVVNLFDVA